MISCLFVKLGSYYHFAPNHIIGVCFWLVTQPEVSVLALQGKSQGTPGCVKTSMGIGEVIRICYLGTMDICREIGAYPSER